MWFCPEISFQAVEVEFSGILGRAAVCRTPMLPQAALSSSRKSPDVVNESSAWIDTRSGVRQRLHGP